MYSLSSCSKLSLQEAYDLRVSGSSLHISLTVLGNKHMFLTRGLLYLCFLCVSNLFIVCVMYVHLSCIFVPCEEVRHLLSILYK